MHTGEKALQPFEVELALRCYQCLSSFLPCLMPSHGDARRVLSCIGHLDQPKARLLDDAIILSGRAEDVEANRAPSGNFLVRKRSTDDQSVAEQHAPAGLQQPK